MSCWLLFTFSKQANTILSSILIVVFKFFPNDIDLSTHTNLHRFAHLLVLPKDLEKDHIWEFQIGNKLSFFL